MTTLADLGVAFAKYRKKAGGNSNKTVRYPRQLQAAVRVFRSQHPEVSPGEIAAQLEVATSTVGKWSKGQHQDGEMAFLPIKVVADSRPAEEGQQASNPSHGTRIDCGKLTITFAPTSSWQEVKAVVELLLAG